MTATWCGWCGSPIYEDEQTETVNGLEWHDGCVADHAKTETESEGYFDPLGRRYL